MKAGMKVTGAKQLEARLYYVAQRVPANGRKIMRASAKRIEKEAKLNAPVDDGELEDSIHQVFDYEDRGRLRISVVAGGVVRGVNVDRYAMLIHENYESMKPGPNTIAKRLANPGRWIGSKFLERARQQESEKLMKAMIDSVTEDLK